MAAVLVFHLYPRKGADRVRHALDWSACTEIDEQDGVRLDYARRWGGVREQDLLVCQNLGPHVYYVRFGSVDARSATLRREPPEEPACVYGSAELVVFTDVSRAERRRTCSDLNGTLR